MKNIFVIILLLFILFINTAHSQEKISYSLQATVLQSVGRDITNTYNSDDNPFTVYYVSRKKFNHPYINVLAQMGYSINRSITIGVQSGIYMHYHEKFFSNAQHTTIAIPLLATLNISLLEFNSKAIGVTLAAGKLFHRLDDSFFSIENGSIYRLSAFYKINMTQAIRVGIEKQIDNVTFFYDDSTIHGEKFKYGLRRNTIFLSYEYRIGRKSK